ncbi:MAG TPA: metal ABC transporter permease [Ruminococcaceae bacterium]|nr:metal ABC transporter permease [Oscillospiraceae bacterium]
MSAEIEIQIIAVLTAASCAIPGVFLVLRKMSMVSDSITHTILLGIVLAFFIVNDLSSPFLLIGAAVMGPVTVWLTEMLSKTRLLSEDSATGMVFPLLFSIAVILITKYAGTAHLDTDSVLLGELAFAPFDRLIINGMDMGAKGVYVSGALLLINIVFTSVFYKELLIVSFDPVLAAVMGFSPAILHYSLMTAASLTAVGAFEAVGSVLVTAFMIAPAAAAYLLTDNLKKMLVIAVGIGGISGILGYRTAVFFEVSIAGSMACWCGIFFLGAFIYSRAVKKPGNFRLKTKKLP